MFINLQIAPCVRQYWYNIIIWTIPTCFNNHKEYQRVKNISSNIRAKKNILDMHVASFWKVFN